MTTANYINLGNLMLEIKMYQKGIDYFMTALNMLKTSPIPLIEYNAYEGLADAYEKSGNYKEALKYRILYEHKKFDHINTERNAQISELEKKYETKNHELKIRDLEITDLKKSNIIEFQNYQLAIRNFWIVLFILGLVLLSFLFYLYYLAEKRRRVKAIEDTERSERQRIAKDMHDEIGAGLSKIILLSNISLKETNDLSKTKNSLTSIADYALKTSENIRELIWLFNTEDLTLKNLSLRLKKKTDDYLEDTNINYNIIIANSISQSLSIVSKDVCRHLIFILQELLQNTIKHSEASEIKLTLEHTNNTLKFHYFDNGKGFESSETLTGNGINNIKHRVHQINGEIIIDSHIHNTNFVILVANI